MARSIRRAAAVHEGRPPLVHLASAELAAELGERERVVVAWGTANQSGLRVLLAEIEKVKAGRTGKARSAGLPADLGMAIEAARDRKGIEPVVLDLRGISDATDYFLIITGTSDTHVRSIAEHILEALRARGTRPGHVEGLRSGRWVLIDCIDFVVHVFHPALREFYQLERLWGDAPAQALEA